MPRIGILCEVSHQFMSDEDCLACAWSFGKQPPREGGEPRHCQYTYPFIHAVCHPYDRSKAGISATMLGGHCIRKTYYERVMDYAIFPSQAHPSIHGTGWHELMDRHTEPEAINEVRLIKTWMYHGQQRSITGQMDYYRPDLGILCDYKVKNELFTVPPEEYVAQLNIYAWMLRTGCTRMDTGEVIQGDVQEMYLLPATHMKQYRPEVPLWTPEQAEFFTNIVYTQLEEAETTLPPRGFETPGTERFCKLYCPFIKQCLSDGGPVRQPPYDIELLVPTGTIEF